MDYQRLAELLFPNVTEVPADVEAKFPPRNLPEGAKVLLYAPTFRKGGNYRRNDSRAEQPYGIPLVETEEMLTQLQSFLEARNCLLIIKIHPMQDPATLEKLHSSDNILNLGATAENFRGTAYEKADDLLNKAVKMDGSEYNGWLGSWGEADTEFDSVDCLKVKVTDETTLTVSGDLDWTLWDKKGKEDLGQLSTLAAGEYIIEIRQDKEKGSLAYSVSLK